MDQTLQNMRGHLTIAQILIILVSLTKALFALEKPWRLGTPLLPSMLTIILSRFQTSHSILFKQQSPNLHVYTLLLLLLFYLAFFAYILSFRIPFLSVEGCRLTAESSFYFFNFLASERFYLQLKCCFVKIVAQFHIFDNQTIALDTAFSVFFEQERFSLVGPILHIQCYGQSGLLPVHLCKADMKSNCYLNRFICTGNRMKARATRDKGILKASAILKNLQFHEQCKSLIALAFIHQSFSCMTEKIPNSRALICIVICTALQFTFLKSNDKLGCSQPITMK